VKYPGNIAYTDCFSMLSLTLVEQLLDHLPRAPFFIKDSALRYVSANQSMLDLCGVLTHADFIGRTARDYFPEGMTSRYERMDRQVMRTRRPIRDQLDLSVRIRGAPVWLLFGRWPVIAARDNVIGVAAIARVLDAPDRRHPIYERLAVAIDYVHSNFRSALDVADLARRAGVSVSQLERDFINLFGLPPRRYLTKVRIETALDLLERSEDAIVGIAHACGYSDQSAFTRRFQASVGMSPSAYRRFHRMPH
jgi:AraC-like DNA-binding protein